MLAKFSLLLLLGLPILAGELPPEMDAKFIKILIPSAQSQGIACKDPAVSEALTSLGVSVNPGAKMAWAASESEVKSLKAAGKLVVCPRLEWLPLGGSIALVEENGKPSIYLHMGNISASGVQLSDAILKIGKKL